MAKIKKDTNLRKSILQAAITGQLISNVEGETKTGKQLLDKIIEERNKKLLAQWEEAKKKNPKAKKPAPIAASEIAEDEIPFEIPESWCWIRGKNIFAPMESIKPYGERFIYIDIDAVNNKLNIIDKPKNLLVKDAPSRASRKLHNGDVLFSMVRPYLKNIAYVDEMYSNAIASTGFYVMTQIGMYNPKFLFYTVLSPYVIDGLHKFMKGDNSPSINTTDIDNFLFPLPPLAVQNAIVAKLEKVLPLVDAYENAVLQKEELKTALPEKVKKAILQEAITGKLTEDWRKTATIEESGKQLLDRIMEERNAKLLADWEEAKKKNPKVKKPAPIAASEITEDEIPFEIPKSWCWCRLGELGLYRKGPFGSSLTKSMFVPRSEFSVKVYEQKNAIQKDFTLGDYYIPKEKFNSMQSFIVEPEDIIISCAGTIGEVYKLPQNAPIGIINQALMRVKLYNDELSAFWMLYFDYVLKKEASKQSSGTAIKNIPPFEILKAYPFPLPPLAEQKKIVEIIEQMLPLCEKLGG